MHSELWWIKWFVILGVGLLLIILSSLIFGSSSAPTGPAEVFEAHLLALDEGRLEDANALLDITCDKVDRSALNAVKADFRDTGLTFQTAFRVSEVWLNERKTEAILDLNTSPRLPLPSVQGMIKVDGKWRLSCG